MGTDYIYWIFVVVVGALIPLLAQVKSTRVGIGVALLGVSHVFVALVIGLSSDFKTSRVISLLLFDKGLTPMYGTMEYRLIAVGYALFIGGAALWYRAKPAEKQ